MRLFALEIDGIDDGVGALGSFDGFDEGLSAPAVAAIGEDDDGFAAGLLAHEFVGGEEERVVENGATAAAGTTGGRLTRRASTAMVAAVEAGVGSGLEGFCCCAERQGAIRQGERRTPAMRAGRSERRAVIWT